MTEQGKQFSELEQPLEYGSETPMRFVTCGSAGSGKSTLLERILIVSSSHPDDEQIKPLTGANGPGAGSFESEQPQGDAISVQMPIHPMDVPYQDFSTASRKFAFSDIEGQDQYTSLITMSAFSADLAMIVVDAQEGITSQTRAHIQILALLGITKAVLVINKMDLVNYRQDVFQTICDEFEAFSTLLDEGYSTFESIAVPTSAQNGDNLISTGPNMPWYEGETLLEYLDTVVADDKNSKPFRMQVQAVGPSNADPIEISGQISSGQIQIDDKIKVLPSATEARISSLKTADVSIGKCYAGQSISIQLSEKVVVAPGDIVASAENPCEVADQFSTTIIWMSENPMLPGRAYIMKCAGQTARATITAPKYKVNIDTLAHEPATKLDQNEIGECNIAVDGKIAFDHYTDNRETGSFLLIDRLSNATVGMGMIRFALRRASNIHWQSLDIDKKTRAVQKNQRPAVLWFTGLSGSGKSTIANILEKKLTAFGKHTYCLDGDNVRHGLNKDLGFTDVDRVENIRRVTEVSKLMADAGLIALVSFISPFRSERRMARNAMEDGEFLEIYVDTPLDVAEERDVKGLYKKARAGEIKNFTGIDSPYEPPQNPEIQLNTVEMTAEEAAEQIIKELEKRGIV